MRAVFLSASIPIAGRVGFDETVSPFLIQCAVEEFLVCTLGRRLIVWGGHPAIAPMVWAACESLGVTYSDAVILYQSTYFADSFPEENAHFKNVVYTDTIKGDRKRSLRLMRKTMLRRQDLDAAVFIGGMEGILEEYALFTKFHPAARIVTVPVAGGAVQVIAKEQNEWNPETPEDLDFARLFHRALDIRPDEPRMADSHKFGAQ